VSGTIRLGTAGWVYPAWRDNFYPKGLPQKQELGYASARLGAIEINSTFYSHQKPQSFAAWAAEAPDGFQFAVKGHQFITHVKRLKEVEAPLSNFFASGVMALGSKLGPFCWQLPGNATYDAERMEAFLSLLPHSPEALVALAGRHDDKLKTPPFLATDGIGEVRHAIEVRHDSFAVPEFVAQLRRHGVALVIADTANWPYWDQTAGFSYARLQGAPGQERYSEAERTQRGAWIEELASGVASTAGPLVAAAEQNPSERDVFAFFVSTDKEHAPANARAVMAQLGLAGPGGR
jgi:uncharacterized protein YecE (DUF72 family)